jgi:hypothetical protein
MSGQVYATSGERKLNGEGHLIADLPTDRVPSGLCRKLTLHKPEGTS